MNRRRQSLRPILHLVLCTLLLVVVGSTAQLSAETPAPSAKRPMTPEDLWSFKRPSSPVVSPDGQWVVVRLSEYSIDDNKGNSDLWLAPTDGSAAPRRLTWNDGSDGNPAWSPDGKWLAFTSKRGDGPTQLYRLSMVGPGEAEALTELPMSASDPRWVDDGTIFFTASTYAGLGDDFEAIEEKLQAQKDDKTEAKITENRLLRFWDHYRTDGQVSHVFSLDLETRKVHDLMPEVDNLVAFRGLAWDVSDDGRWLVFSGNSSPPPWQELDWNLFLLDLSNGEMRTLTADDPASEDSPKFSPDGRFIYYGRKERPNIAPDFTRLARYELASGDIEVLTGAWDQQPSSWVVSADGESLFFHAQDRGRQHLYTMPVDGGAPDKLVSGGRTSSVTLAGDDRLVYMAESMHRPPDVMSVSVFGGTPTAVTDLHSERLADLDLGRVGNVIFAGADDDAAQMFVLYPPGFDSKKKWPLLMLVHGGPHGAWLDAFHFRWNAALFAAPGYVVAALNFHGSTGFGQDYAESILGNHAEKPFEDVMKATDAMLGMGFIDEQRMAAAGGSYGGYLVSWILGHTDRFAALVNHAGVYDLMGQFASDYTWSRDNNYGAAPWQDPNRIDLYSPSRFAENFNTPTLILHGEKDYRVPYTQGVNLHGVLTGKGVPSRIVIFPHENHWIAKPQAAQLWWGEVHGWLDRHIGTGPTENP